MDLRVEKNMSVIEQHISPAPLADSTTQEKKPVSSYVLKMKGYMEQLKHFGYVLPQDLSVGLIMNGLTSDFTGFVRNYNMYNMGKTIDELHALLIEYEKCLPKKAATPQPKNPKPSTKEHPTKDDTCHYCKEVGHWKRNCHAYLDELIKKKKQVGTAIRCLVDLPPNGKTVGNKRIFKKKTSMEGIVHSYKDHLLAKGFTQTYGVDYEETFSPVADIRAIRILIAIASFYDHEIWQMDVKTAFLIGYLNEDIYMVQPEGFVDPKLLDLVSKFTSNW
nr:zinc finger, CCHC-type [Tanacetum cinerariifolium]